jgi:hypothetical protein
MTSTGPKVTVEKARPAMEEEILDLLMEFNNPNISREMWRRVLAYRWARDEDYHGLALVAGGRIVGYMGLLFSRRDIGGRVRRFANLTGWIVRKTHRAHALELVRPLADLADCTLTNFTTFPEGVPVMRWLGFQDLDAASFLIPAAPLPGGGGGWRATSDPARLASILSPADRRLFEDHRPYRCRHVVLHHPEQGYGYMLFTTRRRRGISYAFAHHISRPDLFRQRLNVLRRHLLIRHRVMFFMVDSRLLGGRPPPFSRVHHPPVPRLYKPAAGVTSDQVDSLYSELILLQ